ncbi:hypothetical protein P7K49_037942 [Saguinus oedipus]|uniref:Uncharacterized protein n=1 Tax=Saguinus oedipus TaxID=9490 RepID=A0ABQ9TD83_SAGOE|nr:hypothetical protein P7K49_037942 [Saguinus oedipus]
MATTPGDGRPQTGARSRRVSSAAPEIPRPEFRLREATPRPRLHLPPARSCPSPTAIDLASRPRPEHASIDLSVTSRPSPVANDLRPRLYRPPLRPRADHASMEFPRGHAQTTPTYTSRENTTASTSRDFSPKPPRCRPPMRPRPDHASLDLPRCLA